MTVSPTDDAPSASEVLVPVGPLISQIPVDGDGFPTTDLAEHWRARGCGIACLRMILSTYKIEHGSYWSLISDGVDTGAYCDRGWIHRGLVDMAFRHGVDGWAHRNQTTSQLCVELIAGHLVIASVTVCFRGGQPRPDAPDTTYSSGGHLVLVTGARFAGTGDPAWLRVHHPSATPANNLSDRWVSAERFKSSFSGNYMAFPKPSSTGT